MIGNWVNKRAKPAGYPAGRVGLRAPSQREDPRYLGLLQSPYAPDEADNMGVAELLAMEQPASDSAYSEGRITRT